MLVETTSATSQGPQVRSSGAVNPVDRSRRVRAVLFDVDGTLYRQTPVRARMALELAAFAVLHPSKGRTVVRVLSEYRRAQETLRAVADKAHPSRQAAIAAERAGVPVACVDRLVDEWMIERPLKHLGRSAASGLHELLSFLHARQIPAGVLSDYPAAEKLRALGIAERLSLVLCAADVGAFKPDRRGFLAAAARWQMDPGEILYVGDRADVDAAGAAAARMPCVILSSSREPARTDYLRIPSLERLRNVLDDHDCQ